MKTELYEFDADIVKETQAYVQLDTGKDLVWVPKDILKDNGDGTFTVPLNYAINKGIA